MKIFICSDIHGDLDSMQKVIEKSNEEKAEKIIILGDLLYHGPRNDLPSTYAPKKVIELLNENKSKILTIRGNCDTEVDQMVLDFPILADYALIELDGLKIFATHGHHHNTETPPPLMTGDILLHGHTHLLTIESFGDKNTYINPGSIALPKGGNPRTYMIYENRRFTIKDLDGNVVKELLF
ncbi:MAG: phosphodiesterase [Clostridia bacterium]|nr:phosphodiesterase [Clostridia bacterium]